MHVREKKGIHMQLHVYVMELHLMELQLESRLVAFFI